MDIETGLTGDGGAVGLDPINAQSVNSKSEPGGKAILEIESQINDPNGGQLGQLPVEQPKKKRKRNRNRKRKHTIQVESREQSHSPCDDEPDKVLAEKSLSDVQIIAQTPSEGMTSLDKGGTSNVELAEPVLSLLEPEQESALESGECDEQSYAFELAQHAMAVEAHLVSLEQEIKERAGQIPLRPNGSGYSDIPAVPHPSLDVLDSENGLEALQAEVMGLSKRIENWKEDNPHTLSEVQEVLGTILDNALLKTEPTLQLETLVPTGFENVGQHDSEASRENCMSTAEIQEKSLVDGFGGAELLEAEQNDSKSMFQLETLLPPAFGRIDERESEILREGRSSAAGIPCKENAIENEFGNEVESVKEKQMEATMVSPASLTPTSFHILDELNNNYILEEKSSVSTEALGDGNADEAEFHREDESIPEQKEDEKTCLFETLVLPTPENQGESNNVANAEFLSRVDQSEIVCDNELTKAEKEDEENKLYQLETLMPPVPERVEQCDSGNFWENNSSTGSIHPRENSSATGLIHEVEPLETGTACKEKVLTPNESLAPPVFEGIEQHVTGILKESRSSAAEFLRKGKSSAVGFNGEVEIMEAKNPIETGASSERILQLLDKSRDFEYEWPTLGKVYVEPSKPDTRQKSRSLGRRLTNGLRRAFLCMVPHKDGIALRARDSLECISSSGTEQSGVKEDKKKKRSLPRDLKTWHLK